MIYKYKIRDRVKLLDFRHETSNNCPENHFWVDKMTPMIGTVFSIQGRHNDESGDAPAYYTLNNEGAQWGFCEHWLTPDLIELPEELFEI